MRQTVFILMVLIGTGAGWALESPVGSPIGSPTQVPSARQSGLIPSRPNTAGSYANDIVTGNVGGGRQFRGVVPYSSFLYSQQGFDDSGSVSVSNFIRRSTGYETYYDPQRTVTTLKRDGLSGLQPPVVGGQAAPAVNPSQAWLDSFDLTRVITPPRQARPLVEPDLSPRVFEEGEADLYDEMATLDPLKRYFPEEVREGEETVPDALTVPRPEDVRPMDEVERSNLYENIREQLRQEQEEAVPQEPAVEEKEPQEEPQKETPEEALARAQAPVLRREYGSFKNLAQVRYGEYMDLGQKLLREGRFYKAADAFELANVWDPESSLARLARSHALLGAGEYMSSAYYLHEALNRDPDLARVRVKIESLVGGRDLYESRINELTTWQTRSQSGEMALLLSYLMFMDNKAQRATDLLEQAAGVMPESKAVAALQRAIANPQDMIQAAPETP